MGLMINSGFMMIDGFTPVNIQKKMWRTPWFPSENDPQMGWVFSALESAYRRANAKQIAKRTSKHIQEDQAWSSGVSALNRSKTCREFRPLGAQNNYVRHPTLSGHFENAPAVLFFFHEG